jgi:hypothetical protein
MAGWTDNMNGTWTITPTITVPTAVKDQFEQIRKGINYLYFTTASEMSDEEFCQFLLEGKTSDRSEPELSGRLVPPQFSFPRLWLEFKKFWVDRRTRVESVDSGDTEALAVVVPSPPAP